MCDCTLDADAHARLRCIADMDGTCHHAATFDRAGKTLRVAYSHRTGYWADWDPVTGAVHFGGHWGHVPDLHTAKEPPKLAVYAHAREQGGHHHFTKGT